MGRDISGGIIHCMARKTSVSFLSCFFNVASNHASNSLRVIVSSSLCVIRDGDSDARFFGGIDKDKRMGNINIHLCYNRGFLFNYNETEPDYKGCVPKMPDSVFDRMIVVL